MIVARASATGFEVLTSEKEVIRLGTGGNDVLSDDAMDRGIRALHKMRGIANAYGAQIFAVATSAVREAKNADDFIGRIHTEIDIPVKIISGSEEARLIFLGVSNCLALGDDKVLMVDIGGGSTEFSLSRGGHLDFAQSLKLGAVRLTDMFLTDAILNDAAVNKMVRHISSKFSLIAHDLRSYQPHRVVLSSGTAETIARMAAIRRTGSTPLTMNGFTFSRAELEVVFKEIIDCETPKERSLLDGMDPKRGDIIAAGAIILRVIVKGLDVEQLEYSDYSLREGVLFDSIDRIFGTSVGDIDSSLDSVRRLAQRCSVDMNHAAHVAYLSAEILRRLGLIFDIDTSNERLLVAAAYLANSGAAVSYSKHHLHSYYIIRNGDLLGFTDEEIEMIALIARYHRKAAPKQSHPEFARLDDEQQAQIELLAGILRIATALDRSHDQCVSRVEISLTTPRDGARAHDIAGRSGQLVFAFELSKSSSEQSAELNRQTACERTTLLEEVLGEEIAIRFSS